MNLQRREEIRKMCVEPARGGIQGAKQIFDLRDAINELFAHIDTLEQTAAERAIRDVKAQAVVVPPLPKPTGRRADDAPVWGMPEDLEDVCCQAGNPALAAYQTGIRRGHAIAENSVRAIPADRVLGEGMVAVERDIEFLSELGEHLEAYRERNDWSAMDMAQTMVRDWKDELQAKLDSLRANQGGAAT